MIDRNEPDQRDPGFSYFRYGEVVLLLEDGDSRRPFQSYDPGNRRPIEGRAVDDVRGVLRQAGVDLNDDAFTRPDEPRTRALLPMRRAGRRGVRALQAVYLRSWLPEPDNVGDFGARRRAIHDVGTAVNVVNRLVADAGGAIAVGDYQLVAASPNWLALPFNT